MGEEKYIDRWISELEPLKEKVLDSDTVRSLKQLSTISSRLRATENWIKEFGDPNIRENIKKISDNADKALQASLKAQKAADKAQNALDTIPVAVEDAKKEILSFTTSHTNVIKNELKNYTNAIRVNLEKSIEKAEDAANNAIIIADNAVARAKTVLSKIQNAGTQLIADSKNIKNIGETMIETLETEFDDIKNGFVLLGQSLWDAALNIKDNTMNVKDELVEAKNEIQEPLDKVKVYAKRIWDHPLIFMPYNVFMALYWGFIKF